MKRIVGNILSIAVGILLSLAPASLAGNADVRVEDPSRRDAYSRHYRLDDGRWQAEIHGRPVHFRDPGGAWKPIDTALAPCGTGFENLSNILQSRFNEQGVGYAVRGGGGLTFAPGAIRVVDGDGTVRVLGEAQPVTPVLEKANRVRYADVFPGVDYVYEVRPGTVKAFMVVRSRSALPARLGTGARLEFSGLLVEARPLQAVLEDGTTPEDSFDTSGSVAFRAASGRPVLALPAPVAWDGGLDACAPDGSCATPRYRFARTPAGWDFAVSLPAEWILDGARSYPIVVDPTFTTSPASNFGWLCLNNGAGSYKNGNGATGPAITGVYRSWYNWDVSSIPDSSTITQVDHRTYLDATTTSSGAGTVTIYDFTSANGYGPYTAYSTAVYNDLGGGVSYGTFTANALGYYPSINTYYTLSAQAVTDMQNSLAGNTFQIGYDTTSTANCLKRFGDTTQSGAVCRQAIAVTYTGGTTTFTLTVASAHGTPSPAVGSHTYVSGASVTCSVASPVAGATGTRYVCTGYTGTGDLAAGGTGTSVTFTITQNSSITWTWQTEYQLTTAVSPAGAGTVTATPAGPWFVAGTSVSLQAAGNTGYTFSSWSGSVTGTTNPATLVMNAPASVTANFQVVVGPALTVASPQGSPTPAVGVHAYASGASVTCSVSSPVSGAAGVRYVCTGWTGTGDVPASRTATSTTFTITQASSITWTWRTEYQLATAVQPAGSGTVTVTPAQTWFASGASVSLLAAPAAGCSFVSWSGAVTGTLNPAVLVMDAPKTATANFTNTGAPGLTLAAGPANPGPAEVPPLTAGVSVLQLRLTATAAEAVDVSAVRVSVSGGSDESITVTGVHAYLDADADAVYTPGTDAVLHSGAMFASDDGTVLLALIHTLQVTAGGFVDLLVTFDLDATPGDDFTASVAAGSDVIAQGAVSLTAVSPLGAPVIGGTITVSDDDPAPAPDTEAAFFFGGCAGGPSGGGGPPLWPWLALCAAMLFARRTRKAYGEWRTEP